MSLFSESETVVCLFLPFCLFVAAAAAAFVEASQVNSAVASRIGHTLVFSFIGIIAMFSRVLLSEKSGFEKYSIKSEHKQVL